MSFKTLKTNAVSNPNLLINGDFQVWQRGETFNEAYNQYTADRWAIVNMNSSDTTKVKVSHLELTSNLPQGNIRNAMWIQNAKEGRTALRYIFNKTCKGKSMLSFYVMGTGSKIQVAINSFSNIINVKTTNDWTRAEIPCEDVNYIYFILGEGETYITGVKLEYGTIATKVNPKSYSQELEDCRYYYEHICIGNNKAQLNWTNNNNDEIYILVECNPKRGTPTISTDWNGSWDGFWCALGFLQNSVLGTPINQYIYDGMTHIILKYKASSGTSIYNSYNVDLFGHTFDNLYIDAEFY